MWVEASLMRKSWLCNDLGGRHLSGRNSLCKGPETGASLWWETVNQRMGSGEGGQTGSEDKDLVQCDEKPLKGC